jgi:hypothetical protein
MSEANTKAAASTSSVRILGPAPSWPRDTEDHQAPATRAVPTQPLPGQNTVYSLALRTRQEVPAYRWEGRLVCPRCIFDRFGEYASPRAKTAEEVLDEVARVYLVSRRLPEAFDDHTFPRRVLSASLPQRSTCALCGTTLRGSDGGEQEAQDAEGRGEATAVAVNDRRVAPLRQTGGPPPDPILRV